MLDIVEKRSSLLTNAELREIPDDIDTSSEEEDLRIGV